MFGLNFNPPKPQNTHKLFVRARRIAIRLPECLFIVAIKTFSFLVPPEGDKVGILTNSGGNAVFFSDNVEKFNLKLAEFSDTLKEKISPHLISLVQKINPLDMIGVAEEQQYYNVAREMFEDPGIDIVVGSAVIPPFLGMESDEIFADLSELGMKQEEKNH